MKQFFFNKGPLSQWFPALFEVNGVTFNCAEQYMMAMKAKLFGDAEVYEQIMDSSDPRHQKELGRRIRNFDPEKWNKVAREIVFIGNLAKFSTRRLRNSLISTGDSELIEASPNDCVWGIGIGIDDPDRFDKAKWRGTNWLGETLMKVREELNNQPE